MCKSKFVSLGYSVIYAGFGQASPVRVSRSGSKVSWKRRRTADSVRRSSARWRAVYSGATPWQLCRPRQGIQVSAIVARRRAARAQNQVCWGLDLALTLLLLCHRSTNTFCMQARRDSLMKRSKHVQTRCGSSYTPQPCSQRG